MCRPQADDITTCSSEMTFAQEMCPVTTNDCDVHKPFFIALSRRSRISGYADGYCCLAEPLSTVSHSLSDLGADDAEPRDQRGRNAQYLHFGTFLVGYEAAIEDGTKAFDIRKERGKQSAGAALRGCNAGARLAQSKKHFPCEDFELLGLIREIVCWHAAFKADPADHKGPLRFLLCPPSPDLHDPGPDSL